MSALHKTGIVGAVLALAALFLLFDPLQLRWLPPCPLHAVTGWNCPGCGSTRALHQLLHGNLSGALRLNPLFVLALPVAAWWLLRKLVASKPRPAVPPLLAPALATAGQPARAALWPWLVLGWIIAFGILRNIPVYPFVLLSPG